MTPDDVTFDLLQPPTSSNDAQSLTIERHASAYQPLHRFVLRNGSDRHYQQQFADMYFMRLAAIKDEVEKSAAEHWADYQLGGERPRKVERVLDVRQGELCWVVGTVFVQSSLKPNVIAELLEEHEIAAPPPQETYVSSEPGVHERMLEDESGRLRIITPLNKSMLVTGCVVAAMGHENSDGVFEVVQTRVADLPRQPDRWERAESALAVNGGAVKKKRPTAGKVAFVSGLAMGDDGDDIVLLDMLLEYLRGETVGAAESSSTAQISRLVIAGNSLADTAPILDNDDEDFELAPDPFDHDATSYDTTATDALDAFLSALLPTLPVTLLPGLGDPAGVAIPQQPIHPALFPQSRLYSAPPTAPEGVDPSWFDSVTNPWEGDIDGWRILGTSGQPIDDLAKYVERGDRLEMLASVLRWRCNAPTAPDTLWCYPFQDEDPLLIEECPHVYFAGCQPRFETSVISGPTGQEVRLITIPKFKETGQLVLLDMETLVPECVQFEVQQKTD